MVEDIPGGGAVLVAGKASNMRIFIFKSEKSSDLRAFGGDLVGSQLPRKFSPWRVVGAIAPDREPPYNLSRAVIETAISNSGYQLWRMSKKMADGEKTADGEEAADSK